METKLKNRLCIFKQFKVKAVKRLSKMVVMVVAGMMLMAVEVEVEVEFK